MGCGSGHCVELSLCSAAKGINSQRGSIETKLIEASAQHNDSNREKKDGYMKETIQKLVDLLSKVYIRQCLCQEALSKTSCPGMQLGLYALDLAVAHLLHCFSWELPDGMIPSEMDVSDVFGLTAPRAIRLVTIPTKRVMCPLD
ncbi:hypothetical protein P8452_46191 [Trifolium repens]|nr:hypothetical protein P8452_46191 [Trifolium repens]